MRKIAVAAAALVALAGVPLPAAAQQVPAAITQFYDALTAAPGKDVAGLLTQATTPGWISCGGNDVCGPRERVIAAIAARHREIPDLRWAIKEVLVSGERVIVRGEATGTPAGEFLGVPQGGKSFRIMSIDVHTMAQGKIARSYHIEDWLGATRQLAAK